MENVISPSYKWGKKAQKGKATYPRPQSQGEAWFKFEECMWEQKEKKVQVCICVIPIYALAEDQT